MSCKYDAAEFDDISKPTLEKRLQNYLHQKRINKKNGVEDKFLERQYSIDGNDIQKIKKFLEYKKAEHDPSIIFKDQIDTRGGTFPSMTQQHDKRLDRIKEKQRRDKEANEQRFNYDILTRGYDMYRGDRNFASATGNDFKSQFNPNVWMNSTCEDNSDDINPNEAQIVDNKRRYANTHVYKHVEPKIDYRNYQNPVQNFNNENYSLDSIIGNLDSYRNKVQRVYEPKSEMDHITKVVLPGNNCKDKRETVNNYQSVPFMNGPLRDVNAENFLAHSSSQVKSKKSQGYPNPVEHYFSYISNDIQNPNHVVFERGMPSRMWNKDVAKNTYRGREVMM
jgi:hypothetical protein